MISCSVGSVHSVMVVEGSLNSNSVDNFEEEVQPGVMVKSQTVESVESLQR